MKKWLLLFQTFIALNLSATEFEIKESKEIKPDKESVPIRLIHYDENLFIYTKGTAEYNTLKSVDFLDKDLKPIKSIPIDTKLTDRADYMLWTGERLVLFWEKRVKNHREISIQTIDRKGITSPRKVLDLLENSYSIMMKAHSVYKLSSENKKYHAIVLHNSWNRGLNSEKDRHYLFTIIFNNEGEIIYQKRINTEGQSPEFGMMEISNEGELMNFFLSQKELKVSKFNFITNQTDTTILPFALPVNIKKTGGVMKTYFDLENQTIDFFGRGYKDGEKGFSGEFFFRYDKKNNKIIDTKYYSYDKDFIEPYKKSKENLSGSLVFNDGTFSLKMVNRKLLKRPEGGYYLIKEFHSDDIGLKTNSVVDYILDFLITAYDADGKVEWVKRVPKSQAVFHTEFGFFNSFLDKDDLYLVYNESTTNMNKDLNDNFESTNLILGEIKPIIRKIDSKGNVETYDVSEHFKSKFTFSPLFSYNLNSPYNGIATIAKKKSRTPLTEYNLIRIRVK